MSDDIERQLRVELMTVQIKLFSEQVKWEPWKAMAVAAGAGAGLMAAVTAIVTALVTLFLRSHS